MTDPDFASFGEPNRSRPEGYRLTHPRNESASGSMSALTGFDPGRGSLGRPEVTVAWAPADIAPEWATGTAPSATPAPNTPVNGRNMPRGRSESLMSSPDSVAIRSESGTPISDSVAIRRQSEAPTGSEFSAFSVPTGGPGTANPHSGLPGSESITPNPRAEFGVTSAQTQSGSVTDPVGLGDAAPTRSIPELPRRTPGLPQRFTESDNAGHYFEEPGVNSTEPQFNSTLPGFPAVDSAVESAGSVQLTNGSTFHSAETSHLPGNSMPTRVDREAHAATPAPISAESGPPTAEPSATPADAGLRSGAPAQRRANHSEPAPGAAAPAPGSTEPAGGAREFVGGGRRRAPGTGLRPTDDSPTAAPARAAHRRIPAQEATQPGVDVHLVMHLLLASHTLETLADKAEAGDVSLEEFIRAARRTRTAAVDLVSAWFGGADQMRQFAEALLAAAEST